MQDVVFDEMFYCLEQLQQDSKKKTLIHCLPLPKLSAVTLQITIIFLHYKKQGTTPTKRRPFRKT